MPVKTNWNYHLNNPFMKKVKLLLVTVFLVVCAGSIFAFRTLAATNPDSGVILIKTFQYYAGDVSVMYIYYGNSKVEEIRLDKTKGQADHKNWDLILNTISKFYAEGYHLVASTETGEASINSTFILSK